jgi:hypothetical protein
MNGFLSMIHSAKCALLHDKTGRRAAGRDIYFIGYTNPRRQQHCEQLSNKTKEYQMRIHFQPVS